MIMLYIVQHTTYNLIEIMKANNFGKTLRKIREDGNISLRSLAKESEVDAAYLSRVERELNPAPKAEVIQKIAETLCQIMKLDTANCEKLKRTLLESSEQLADHSDLIRDLKHRFADRLRDEGVEDGMTFGGKDFGNSNDFFFKMYPAVTAVYVVLILIANFVTQV